MYDQLYSRLKDLKISQKYPEAVFYHANEYKETDLDVETAVTIDRKYLHADLNNSHLSVRLVPAQPNVASIIYEGPYSGVVSAVLSLLAWVGLNEWRITGPLCELHLSGSAHKAGRLQEKAILELQIPIDK